LVDENVSDSSWSWNEVNFLEKSGGNARSNSIFEKYMPEYWKNRVVARVHSSLTSCSLEEREVFVRAKYEAYAFVSPIGPFNTEYERISKRLNRSSKSFPLLNQLSVISKNDKKIELLPNRLVDYYCIVGPDPQYILDQNDTFSSLSLESKVLDSYPKNPHQDMKLPEQLSRFVFPDGCSPVLQPPDPIFFTFVLTLETGVRIYGCALTIFDESCENEHFATLLRKRKQFHVSPRLLMQRYNGDSPPINMLENLVFFPKTQVLLSHYPFFEVFRTFLEQLYRISLVESQLPLERYIANFVC